ncbi:MAG: methyltransferase domain-containing protein [Methanobacteriota archaeon]|nr:MAG: methyltransferase domain-containing protein [Euryarchaeota archaeon]
MRKHECDCRSRKELKQGTRRRYEAQWGGYDIRKANERRLNNSPVADPLLRMILPFTGKTMVDLGVGTGGFAFRAMEFSAPERMIGVDFSSHALQISRAIARTEPFAAMDFEAVLGDVERIPIASRSADIILSQASFNLLPDKESGLKEMARIAKPGAKLLLSDVFRTKRKCEGESWEACVGGALTVAEFSTATLSAGIIITQQTDFTQKVLQLVKSKKWDWPEFVEHKLDYRGFVMQKA